MTEYAVPVDEVIKTNQKLTGANHLLLDRGKLEGAIARPMHTWGGQYVHSTALERAGALLHSLANAHAFLDGNKRTAWLSCNMFLNAFNSSLHHVDPLEMAEFVECVVKDDYEVSVIALWLSDRLAE